MSKNNSFPNIYFLLLLSNINIFLKLLFSFIIYYFPQAHTTIISSIYNFLLICDTTISIQLCTLYYWVLLTKTGSVRLWISTRKLILMACLMVAKFHLTFSCFVLSSLCLAVLGYIQLCIMLTSQNSIILNACSCESKGSYNFTEQIKKRKSKFERSIYICF